MTEGPDGAAPPCIIVTAAAADFAAALDEATDGRIAAVAPRTRRLERQPILHHSTARSKSAFKLSMAASSACWISKTSSSLNPSGNVVPWS